MGSPTIFSGRYTKLLTNKGILNSDGSLNQNDGPINYVKYAEFEQNVTTGWSLGTTGTLTNAIPTGTPSFGSGASGNLSIATSNVSPIRDNFSLRYVSSAATTAGNMLATEALTIDAADQAKVLTFRFYYSVVSGATTANFSGTSSNSFGVAIWDVTNSAWIGVAGNFSMTQNSGVGIASGTFQTNSNTSQIRLVIYNANATSGAITLAFDDFFVGPQTAPIGPVVTDWVSYTPTGSWTSGVTSYTGRWRRVGDSAEFDVTVLCSGAVTATPLTINLPTGMSIDTAKLSSTTFDVVHLGTARVLDSGIIEYGIGFVKYTSPTSVTVQTSDAGSTYLISVSVRNNVPMTFGANDTVQISFKAPISGWSSNVQLSNDTDTRVVGFSGYVSGSQTVNHATNTLVTFIKDYDTHSTFNGSNSYTIPVSGFWQLDGWTCLERVGTVTSIPNELLLKVNGNITGQACGTDAVFGQKNGFFGTFGPEVKVSSSLYLKAGDVITLDQLHFANNSTGNVSATVARGRLTCIRISGPSVVAASETVAARYFKTATQSFSVETKLTGYTRVFDTHGAWDSTNNWYRFPISGKYLIQIQTQSSPPVAATQVPAYRINGGSSIYIGTDNLQYGKNTRFSASSVVSVNAGDYIEIVQFTDASTAVQPTEANTHFTITRLGN